MDKLEKSTADLSLKSLNDKLGLHIETDPFPTKATVLKHPKLLLGGGHFIDESRANSFAFKSLPIYDKS